MFSNRKRNVSKVLRMHFCVCPRQRCQTSLIYKKCRARNDLLEEHPELREELEDEIKAMQEEQAARRAEVEGLQEQLSESETKASDASGSENTAFVSRNQNKEESSDGRASAEEHVATSEQGATADDGEANANLDIDISEEEPIVEEEILEQIVDEVDDVVVEDVLQDQESATDEEKSEPTTTSDDASVGSTNEAVAKEETSNKDDLTLAAFVEEFVEYIRNDIQKFHKTFQQYVLPVIQPMFKAGNTAVKYIKAAVMTIQKEYNERAQQAEKEEAGQSSTEV